MEKGSEGKPPATKKVNPIVAVGVLGGLALVVAGILYVSLGGDEHGHGHGHEHGSNLAPYESTLRAPEGDTPCETAFLGLEAFRRSVEERNLTNPFRSFPDRETFIRVCNTYPEEDQKCLGPRYQLENREACMPLHKAIERGEAGPLSEILQLAGMPESPARREREDASGFE